MIYDQVACFKPHDHGSGVACTHLLVLGANLSMLGKGEGWVGSGAGGKQD